MTLELFENWACGKSLPLNFETYCRFVTEFREGELAVMRVEHLYLRQFEASLKTNDNGEPIQSIADSVRKIVNGTPFDLRDVCKRISEIHPHLEVDRGLVSNCMAELWHRGEFNREKGAGSFYRYTKKVLSVAILCLFFIGCRAPEYAPVPVSSQRINWYADVNWPESLGAKTYHVGYGLHPNTMTNELVTVTNRCRVYGLELGRTYYFSVRASDGKSYSMRTPITTFKTP